MSVKPGMTYAAEVLSAALTESKISGTPAISLSLETPDGVIGHDLWVTPKTKDRVAKTMEEVFGVTADRLQSMAFIDNISIELAGQKCSITTIEEEYNGKARTKVQWLNPEKKAPSGNIAKRTANLFGGNVTITDEDVPF